MKHAAILSAFAVMLIACTSCTTTSDSTNQASASGSDSPSFKATAEADRLARQNNTAITPYPFKTCAVMAHKPFKDGKPKHRRVYKGQEVLFCCTPCVRAFDMNPEPYMPRILAAAGSGG